MVIESVVWAQYIDMTYTQTDTGHVTIAIAALTHCVVRQKPVHIVFRTPLSHRTIWSPLDEA